MQPVHIIGELGKELEAANHVRTQVDSGTTDSIDERPITDDVAAQLYLFDELTGDLGDVDVKHDASNEIDVSFYNDVDKECITNHIASTMNS